MTRIAEITEFRTDGSVVRYTLTRDALRLLMPELGARVVVMFVPSDTDGDVQ